ncbi:monooxygenase [Hahella sp. CCB-MM4]|uniref:NAD(P)/FAD-dependent oxidoreductase n=1 Tax=Hahella sp. (strain CCB-MM4) TaxID=1926491 RepID=UPI000B9A6E05|nr:FAD-dependent monooxygenase [Hahella sp. CCB-MM4]OZG72755.1 monooxygenase [Hahella sp. CCB-MM4]
MIDTTYDVVILGGGPAGLAAAIAIRNRTQASVLVVERQAPGEERVGENCPPETMLLLKQLGIAKDFYQSGHETCPGYASVWGRADVGYNDFIVNPMGPSWRLNRQLFDKMLADNAEKCGARISWTTQFIDAQTQNEEDYPHTLYLAHTSHKNQIQVKARFVVDATGFKARFAHTRNIQKQVDDQLFAIVRFAQVKQGKGVKQIQLEATPEGWYYQALLPDSKVVSMIVTGKDSLYALREDHYLAFENALAATTFVGPSISKLQLESHSYLTCPIYSGLLPKAEEDNWIAIGDAALSFDPIAAQGIYKALSHGLMAADKVAAFFAKDRSYTSPFSEKVLQQYDIYCQNRAHVYGLERRWLNSEFWQQRSGDSRKQYGYI